MVSRRVGGVSKLAPVVKNCVLGFRMIFAIVFGGVYIVSDFPVVLIVALQ